MSALGLGCVKTPTFNLRVEIPSRNRKFENKKCLRPLLREDDRENNSAHSWLVHVFTQPGSNAEVGARSRHVRYPPDSDRTADIAGGPFRAISRHRALTRILRRRLHQQVRWLLAAEDAIDIAGRASVHVDRIGPVGYQAAGGGEVAVRVDCRQSVPSREHNDQMAIY